MAVMVYTVEERRELLSMFRESSDVTLMVVSDGMLVDFVLGSVKWELYDDATWVSYYTDSLWHLPLGIVRSAIYCSYSDVPLLMFSSPILGLIAQWRFRIGR